MKPILMAMSSVAVLCMALIPSGAGEKNAEPNVLVDVSAAVVDAIVRRQVDRTEPVDEVIQDTPIHGTGRTVGEVRAELVPDRENAAVDIVLRGTSSSCTVGTRPYVLVHTFSSTALDIRQRVLMDGSGIRMTEGPSGAETVTQLLGIEPLSHPEALTLKIARRGFEQRLAASELETAQKTACRVSALMAEALTPALASSSKWVGGELTGLKNAGLTMEALGFSTSSSYLHGRARIATPGRGPATRSPALPPDADVGIRIYESLANALAEKRLAGRSFQVEDTYRIYDDTTRGLLRDLRPADAKKTDLKRLGQTLAQLAGKPVTITFAQKDPLTATFGDQEITVEVRFASIRQDKALYAGPRLKVVYRLENSAKGVVAVRKGTVQVLPGEPSKGEKMQPLPEQFRILQEALFVEVFKERLGLNPIALPEALARQHLDSPNVYARNGWLGIVWRLPKSSHSRSGF